MNWFDVKNEGAVGDGVQLETKTLQRVIDACVKSGGGTVYFPPGTYLTGTLNLGSNLVIHLEAGAIILASPNREADYPSIGMMCERRDTVLIYARDQKNISVVGAGRIEGNGDAFYFMDEPVEEGDYDPARARQGSDFGSKPYGVEDGPVKPKPYGELKKYGEGFELRYGSLMLFVNCEQLTFRDFHLTGSANWGLHLAGCRYATISGLTIRFSLLIPNADCIDVANSQNITITNCLIEGGDDGIAITPCADGYHLSPTENIAVTNCTILSRSCAIRVGYGIKPVKNCIFSNIIIHSSNRGIGVFIRNGQTLENVLFSDIIIETRLHTGWWGAGEPIHISAIPGYTEDVSLGFIRNVRFRNILAKSETGIVIYGADHPDTSHPIRDISFDGLKLEIVPGKLNDRFGGNIDLRPANDLAFKVFKSDLPGLYAKNVKGLTIRNFELIWPEKPAEYFNHAVQTQNCLQVLVDSFTGEAAHPRYEPIVSEGGEKPRIK